MKLVVWSFWVVLYVLASSASARSQTLSEKRSPTPEEIKKYAFDYMKQFPKAMTDRQIAYQLASSIAFLEKIQLICPSYFPVNSTRARLVYLLRQGTWVMMFGHGKTGEAILAEATVKRNRDMYAMGAKTFCEKTKAFATETFGWGELFEVGN